MSVVPNTTYSYLLSTQQYKHNGVAAFPYHSSNTTSCRKVLHVVGFFVYSQDNILIFEEQGNFPFRKTSVLQKICHRRAHFRDLLNVSLAKSQLEEGHSALASLQRKKQR